MIAKLFPAFAAALLVACSAGNGEPPPQPPSPALFEIRNGDGELEGWLFGTMHSIEDGVEWRTDALEAIAERADALILEVAAIDDVAATKAAYRKYAGRIEAKPVRDRIEADRRDTLSLVAEEAAVDLDQFVHTDTWAVAIVLSGASGRGKSENGADKALVRKFAGRPVLELEGAEAQFAIFDALPEADQRDLLHAVIEESQAQPSKAKELAEDWRLGRLDRIEAKTRKGLLSDPELMRELLTNRNRAWTTRLVKLASEREPFLVAVGAAHLPGEEGLVGMLERQGFILKRIQ